MSSKEDFCEAFECTQLPQIQVRDDSVTAVILTYNEGLRLPFFLKYYRKLGVSNFIFVDNNSSDQTECILKDEKDVIVLRTGKPYREYKSIWRQLISDHFFDGKWVLFPDVDELLVYPGWPDITIDKFVEYLDRHDFECLFTTMVDMYPEGPLIDHAYRAGNSFIETCPFFDASGYRHVPLKGAGGREFNTPKRHVFGGARERLFHHKTKRRQHVIDSLLLNTIFRLRSRAPKSKFGRFVDRRLFKLVKDGLPGVDPIMSKVPLIKWRKGYYFSGGVHNVAQEIKMSPDWGSLLHFKYLDDFDTKVTEALERGQHAVGSRFYKDYEPHLESLMKNGAMSDSSRRFADTNSLLACGLMRESKEFRRYFNR